MKLIKGGLNAQAQAEAIVAQLHNDLQHDNWEVDYTKNGNVKTVTVTVTTPNPIAVSTLKEAKK